MAAAEQILEASVRPARADAYAFYVAGVLMLASAFSFLDRMVLSLMIDPIRRDLHLSDTEVSLLAGFAFAACFMVFAFVFGRWADRRSRRNLAAVGIALWSLATVACGLAGSFWRLFAGRMAVGVGEASLNPAAYSMIPDYVRPERRGLAMGVYACGATIGGGLAMVAGGLVVQWALVARPLVPFLGAVAPWKAVFFAVGAPGLLVALLLFATVREPPRGEGVGGGPPTLAETARYVARRWRVFGPMFLGYAGFAVSGYGFQVWGPAYLMRLHGLHPAEVGLVFGVGYGLGGAIGVIAGGLWSDALVRRGQVHGPVKVSLWAAGLQAPLLIAAYLAGPTSVAVPLLALGMTAASLVGGLQAAMVQCLTPGRMRGTMAALYGAVVNMAGLGVAPTLTAILSERVFGGPLGLGKALASTTALALLATLALLGAGLGAARRQAEELRRLEAFSG